MATNLYNIPHDIVLQVFMLLPVSDLLRRVSLVNRYFFGLSRSNVLWHFFYKKVFPERTNEKIYYTFNDFYFTKRLLVYKNRYCPGFPKRYGSFLDGWMFNQNGVNPHKKKRVMEFMYDEISISEIWEEYSKDDFYSEDEYLTEDVE
jgi:hypothetical protein